MLIEHVKQLLKINISMNNNITITPQFKGRASAIDNG